MTYDGLSRLSGPSSPASRSVEMGVRFARHPKNVQKLGSYLGASGKSQPAPRSWAVHLPPSDYEFILRRSEQELGMGVAPHDGLVAVVKRDCPTCELTAPVLGKLSQQVGLQVYTQDDPGFPETVPSRIDDTALDISHKLKIEIVPTLIRLEGGHEVARTYG
jgi:F plasmid transfer operon protein